MTFSSNEMVPFVIFGTIGLIGWVGCGLVNIVFSIAVGRDSRAVRTKGRSLVLVPRWAWILATLFGGVLVGALYWAVHHSSLSKDENAV